MNMRVASLLSLSTTIAASAAHSHEQCFGHTPMPSVSTFMGASLDYSTAERICCNNHKYAEYRGYLEAPEVDLFGKLDPDVETVFYDSVCGIPLFVAPRGRSFDEFKEESLEHGWPSFRPEELVSENVIIHDNGRMESRCLTHLGHNLPDLVRNGNSRDRYCIDLVCVAGEPLFFDDAQDERAKILAQVDESVVLNEEFEPETYNSSAETFSGKHSGSRYILFSVSLAIAIVGAGAIAYLIAWKKGKQAKQRVQIADPDDDGVDEVDAVIN